MLPVTHLYSWLAKYCGFGRLDVLYSLCERVAVCIVLGAIKSGYDRYVQASHTHS